MLMLVMLKMKLFINKTITVLKLNTNIVASNLVKYYLNNQKLSITLKDAKGNLLANQAVTLQIGTSKLTAKTNNKGVATFAVNNKVGNYNAKLSFAGDSKYNPSTKSITIKVVKPIVKPVKSSVKRNSYLQVSFKTYDKKVIKNTKVTIKIKSKTYTVKTNAKGIAKVKVSLPKGKYSLIAAFKDTSVYGKTKTTFKISVS